jgi:hypothetical protein
MSRWLVGSSRIRNCGASKHMRHKARRAFSPPERCAAFVPARAASSPKRARRARTDCSVSFGSRAITWRIGSWSGSRSSIWCWAKKPTFRPARRVTGALHRVEPARQELGQGRLAVAVGAQERDAVVGVEPEVEAVEHDLAVVADARLVERDQRRCGYLRRREGEDDVRLPDRGRQLAHPFEPLDPALGLGGLARLRAEAVDERLDVRPLRLLLRPALLQQLAPLGPARGEGVVVAVVGLELAALEVDDALRAPR